MKKTCQHFTSTLFICATHLFQKKVGLVRYHACAQPSFDPSFFNELTVWNHMTLEKFWRLWWGHVWGGKQIHIPMVMWNCFEFNRKKVCYFIPYSSHFKLMIEIQTILIFNFFYSCSPIIKREKKNCIESIQYYWDFISIG